MQEARRTARNERDAMSVSDVEAFAMLLCILATVLRYSK